MLLRCAVLLLYLMVARTEVQAGLSKGFVSDIDTRYSLWPSIHHGVRLMRLRKREAAQPTTLNPDVQSGLSVQPNTQVVQTNGQAVQPNAQEASIQSEGQSSAQNVAQPSAAAQAPSDKQPELPRASTKAPASSNKDSKDTAKPAVLDNNTVHKPIANTSTSDNSTIIVGNKTNEHNTTTVEPPKIDLSDPGVMKRAAIVFGGFALLATAYYFIIYRKKGNNNDAKNQHSSIDQNQFRYGVLESEDKSSNMELSRVPLTMESDEDDDEDLEIFDLGQKKRSLSYINLEQHDEDIVLNDSRSVDIENLLVDIEDKNSDMINWSGNGSKSIL